MRLKRYRVGIAHPRSFGQIREDATSLPTATLRPMILVRETRPRACGGARHDELFRTFGPGARVLTSGRHSVGLSVSEVKDDFVTDRRDVKGCLRTCRVQRRSPACVEHQFGTAFAVDQIPIGHSIPVPENHKKYRAPADVAVGAALKIGSARPVEANLSSNDRRILAWGINEEVTPTEVRDVRYRDRVRRRRVEPLMERLTERWPGAT